MSEVENRTVRKIMWRLIPFLIACYFVAFIDRTNVSFAKLQMNSALGLSETAYGLGAGLFFVGYFFLEVPSNLALHRFGARLWIARIMISWGVVSGLFAFVGPIARTLGLSNEMTFYALRFLLGVCEAGFFPGVIFYLTLWFPSAYRARVTSFFMLAIPISQVIGAPISGALLGVSGAGLDGWQWLFILEAVPSILMAFGVLFYLTDRPALAGWLQEDERTWLQGRLDQETHLKTAHHGYLSLLKSISDPRILAGSIVYFAQNATGYGVSFFLPTIIKNFGVLEFPDRTAGDAPSDMRRDRYGVSLLQLRSYFEAPRTCRPCPSPRHDRRRRGRPRQFARAYPVLAVRGPIRVFGRRAPVLANSQHVPDRRLSGGGDRSDQRARQPCGIRRALCDGLL